MNKNMKEIYEEESLLDMDLLTFIKEFSCTVSYDESKEKMFSLDLDVASNAENVDACELKDILTELIKDAFDKGVGNLIFMMKNINKEDECNE